MKIGEKQTITDMLAKFNTHLIKLKVDMNFTSIPSINLH